jgi:hypothetical protein
VDSKSGENIEADLDFEIADTIESCGVASLFRWESATSTNVSNDRTSTTACHQQKSKNPKCVRSRKCQTHTHTHKTKKQKNKNKSKQTMDKY